MKILYATVMWTPFAEVLLDGADVCKGMPAFFRPLRRLLEEGNEITMLIVETDPVQHSQPIQLNVDWLKKIRFRRCLQRFTCTGLRKPLSEASAVWTYYHAAREILKEGGYDFVYGHGPHSEGAGVAAARLGIPFGQRRYGDSYYRDIKSRTLLRAICSRPSNYWSYRRPKAFMVATNDSSHIDETYRIVNRGKTPYPLYFWRNGYEPIDPELIRSVKTPDIPYLFYAARIEHLKYQDRAVHLLSEAKKLGITIPLYLAGQNDEPAYLQRLFDLGEELGVSGQIHYMGSISLPEVAAWSAGALACLSLYYGGNFGNVFIEYVTNGGVVLSMDDGSLDDVIRSGENGFLVHDMAEGAGVVRRLLLEPELSVRIQAKAREASHAYFLTWDARVEREIRLIEDAVAQSSKAKRR